jgi:methylated-DNA-protein-cysteine methyltransferase related protein
MDAPGKSKSFFNSVYDIVSEIPPGRVTTYGAIARFLGQGGSARMVGWALNSTLEQRQPDLPCHRVVNRLGQLSGKIHFTGTVMEDMLRQEGVSFTAPDTVNLEKHFWDPAKNSGRAG